MHTRRNFGRNGGFVAPHDQEFAKRVGDAETVRAGVEAAVAASGADEVIAITNTPDPEERRASFRRLAEVFSLPAA